MIPRASAQSIAGRFSGLSRRATRPAVLRRVVLASPSGSISPYPPARFLRAGGYGETKVVDRTTGPKRASLVARCAGIPHKWGWLAQSCGRARSFTDNVSAAPGWMGDVLTLDRYRNMAEPTFFSHRPVSKEHVWNQLFGVFCFKYSHTSVFGSAPCHTIGNGLPSERLMTLKGILFPSSVA